MANNIEENYLLWKQSIPENLELSKQLLQMSDSEKEDSFYKDLEFGTGGLRGVLGVGTNRMNTYTVSRATAGVANYLVKNFNNPSVAIAYDSRNKSDLFAYEAANVFSSFGVKVYIFGELMPTPVLSYAVRELKCSAGVVVTASHNPRIYNGYKVYNENGCQITDLAAEKIMAEIKNCGYFDKHKGNRALIERISKSFVNGFINDILKYSLNALDKKYIPKIVYTPLNGAGNKPVRAVLSKMGAKDILVVPEQENPDGNFTTCPYPNPEIKEALALAVALAKKNEADLVLATDPDSDRVGIAVKDQNGDYRLFSGNETGCLLLDYILSEKTKKGLLPKKPIVVKTIVTTDMAEAITKKYNVEIRNVLTGFKYIGETIDGLDNPNDYVFGMEESYGYLVGTHARDKDAVSAAMMIVEMATYYNSMNKSLIDRLNELYEEYGYHLTELKSITFEGKNGKEKMDGILASLRNNKLESWGNFKVSTYFDYIKGINGFPKSNVLEYLGSDFKLILRPSGTEPKLKIYYEIKASNKDEAVKKCSILKEEVNKKIGV